MIKDAPQDVRLILNGIPLDLLEKVFEFSQDESKMKVLRILLNYLVEKEGRTIISIAGSPKTSDDLIANSMSASFSKGRISMAVILDKIIQFSGDYVDKKTEKGQ